MGAGASGGLSEEEIDELVTKTHFEHFWNGGREVHLRKGLLPFRFAAAKGSSGLTMEPGSI
eukprot:3117865-Rhodomonas_salina.2